MKVCFVLSLIIALCLANSFYSIPDYTGPKISQKTGYIEVDPVLERYYFYWLVESQGNPDTDPLIFWYQGGPGCSGLGALFTEHGPYLPNGNNSITYNSLSWTNWANVVYLEQPAGVGFSFSNTTAGGVYNDTTAANENYNFIEGFLQRYPQFQGRKTWLTGESYAGVYVPTLANVIIQHPDSMIYNQLEGLAVGNPVISCKSLNYYSTQLDLFYWHGLIAYSSLVNWTDAGCDWDTDLNNTLCADIFYGAEASVGSIVQFNGNGPLQPSLNPDDLYQNFCSGNGTLEFSLPTTYPQGCSPGLNQVTDYLNRKDVQKFLGTIDVEWSICGNIDYTPLGESMIPYYSNIFATTDWSVLIYSGDVDVATVPFGFTQGCLAELGEEPTESWQPWWVNTATAGYVETYPDYTYATVKGAGHEVPMYQPLNSYHMIYRFITTGSLIGNEYNPNLAKKAAHEIRKPILTQSSMLRKYGIKF